MPDSPDDTPPPSPSAEAYGPATRSRRRTLGVRIAIVVGLVALLLVGIDYATSAPALCRSCHSTQSRAASWEKSTHSEVACVSCHQPPTAWYALPQRLFARARLLGRDTWWQLTDGSAEATAASAHGVGAVSSENCLQCHDPNRKATSGYRILIDHAEHAKRNKTCLSCHAKTAHPDAIRGKALSLMDQCFKCHGTAEQPKASADCRVCHPSDYQLLPASHKPAKWKRDGHSKIATTDRAQCDLCHEASFCTDCHGVEMPHPAGWAKGAPAGHAAAAETDRLVCARCHLEKPDLCSMCHHRGWEPRTGPWIEQHPLMVEQRGAAFCIQCHFATYCTDCHASRLGVAPATQ